MLANCLPSLLELHFLKIERSTVQVSVVTEKLSFKRHEKN
jgi:hypothetical protein